MNEFCQQQGFSAWFETSAKDNINIDESANFLVSKVTLQLDKNKFTIYLLCSITNLLLIFIMTDFRNG